MPEASHCNLSLDADDIPLVRKSMVVELSKKQLSPHLASVTEEEKYYMVDYITKSFVGRALSVDGDIMMFKFFHPTLGSKLTWPGQDDIEVKHISCVFYGSVQLKGPRNCCLHKYLNTQ